MTMGKDIQGSGTEKYPEIDGIPLGPPDGETDMFVPDPDLAMTRPQALAGVHDPNAPTVSYTSFSRNHPRVASM